MCGWRLVLGSQEAEWGREVGGRERGSSLGRMEGGRDCCGKTGSIWGGLDSRGDLWLPL